MRGLSRNKERSSLWFAYAVLFDEHWNDVPIIVNYEFSPHCFTPESDENHRINQHITRGSKFLYRLLILSEA